MCGRPKRPPKPCLPGRGLLAPATWSLALAGLEAGLGLVDHIDPALTPDNLVVAVPATQRFQRVTDFHNNPIGLAFGRVLKDPAPPCQTAPTTAPAVAAAWDHWTGTPGGQPKPQLISHAAP